ncbi:hypothetical protein EPA93_13775 [Ktedonosporobacter rubrisoli]|uniref:acyl-homoserine-lactone synthase n=1 Tax=Ktedonosporobacter rubrisoli TaxID=2509675 RepID=A0A4P6JP39_KTERU|nr:acyl-homoserine-lactone synthase [Ktedonosporobacter rubrisoli]QBD77015.1 hypothetical protein EPA93_13775 [Ktedonosporobacter rubrisoli]
MLYLDIYDAREQGHRYCIRRIDWHDVSKQQEYQRLRAEIFVKRLGWTLLVDPEGCESDRYDQIDDETINIYGVYGIDHREREHLLAGVRIFQLRCWNDSMVVNEFAEAGMIPDPILTYLKDHYNCDDLLELTRLCVQRGRWYCPSALQDSSFSCAVARDLIYALAYAQAEQTHQRYTIGIVHTGYLRVMKRSHFVFKELYTHHVDRRGGYALAVVDLAATIHAIRAAGEHERAGRMLALCHNTQWINAPVKYPYRSPMAAVPHRELHQTTVCALSDFVAMQGITVCPILFLY